MATVKLANPLNPRDVWITEAHDWLFLSSIDGVYSSYESLALDHDAFGDGPRQAANAYREIAHRLSEIGLDGSAAVRIEHATASQDWRLQRMALWPNHFGLPTTAVSQGYQGKMVRQNMISVASMATRPSLPRTVVTPGPNSGRASRVTKVGDYSLVIGVRGEALLADTSTVGDGEAHHVAAHVRRSFENIAYHLKSASESTGSILRLDAFVRTFHDSESLRSEYIKFFGNLESIPPLNVVACPLGGQTDIEVSAIATSLPISYSKNPYDQELNLAAATKDFVFMSNVNSTVCEARPEVPTNLEEQVVFGISAIIREADRWNLQLSSVVRLDIYSNSQYMFQTIRTLLENRYPELTAALVWHGVDLSGALHVDFAAILAR